MENQEKLLTKTEAAEYLKVSIPQLEILMKRPENPLPVIYISERSPRFRMEDLIKWVESQKSEKSAENH